MAVDGAEDPNKQPESEEEHPTAGGRVEKQGYHLRCGAKSGHHSGARAASGNLRLHQPEGEDRPDDEEGRGIVPIDQKSKTCLG